MEQDILNFRKNFKAYEKCTYLNHAAISPISELIINETNKFLNLRSMPPVDIIDEFFSRKDEFKSLIKNLINAESEKNIAFTTNTSEGLNIIANGMDFKRGDRIILFKGEFPANLYPFLKLEKKGVIIDWVEPDKNHIISINDIEKKITKKTKLLSISFVQFLTGFKAEIKQIGKLCNENNIIFVVDGIQGLGVNHIDVKESFIDVLSTGGHKWLMWKMGTGFTYFSSKILEKIYPSTLSWLSVKDSWNFSDIKLDLIESAEKFEYATPNAEGIFTSYVMLKEFLNFGINQINKRILKLNNILIKGLKDLKYEIISPLKDNYKSTIISFSCNDCDKIFNRLKQNNIHISLREGYLRVSPHFSNNEADINKLLSYL